MDVLQKILSFVVVLGVLVVFHELGHYLVARWCNVKVLRFSVGFGRVVWSRRYGADQTEFAVSAIPLGGYVKMVDERDPETASADLARAFNRASVWQRIAIVSAGPIANLLLAIVLFAAMYMVGVPGQKPILAAPPANSAAAAAAVGSGDRVLAVDGVPIASVSDLRWRLLKAMGHDEVALRVETQDRREATRVLALGGLRSSDWEGAFMGQLGLRIDVGPPLIDQVLPGKPAERAGLRAGDRIVTVDGKAVRSPADVAAATNAKPAAAVVFGIERGGRPDEVTLTTEATEVNGKILGIAGLRLMGDPAHIERLATTVRHAPLRALAEGARKTWELSLFTLRMLGRMVSGEASLKNISGPVTLADYAGQSAQAGVPVFIGYLALISISLGVLNLLPIPLLDGGQLLYYFAEVLRGRPLPDRAFEVGQRIGMAVLAALMALALFNDFSRLF